MPTVLTNYPRSQNEAFYQAKCVVTFLRFYAAVGLSDALLVAAEMFDGLTTAESVLKATGTELWPGEFVWGALAWVNNL
jgi:hypothetical protein